MEISGLHVDGFGVWTALAIEGFAPGLNVVFGPNEAGKSTLLEFMRSMLYGLSSRRGRFLPPVHGGRPGGVLRVVGQQAAGELGSLEIRRHLGPGGEEAVNVTAADGTRHSEHMLKVLLANIDEPLFSNVFAIGLREVQELGTLSDTQASQLLYGLSTGLDRVSLLEVTGELKASRNRLLDSSGSGGQILQLLADRQRLLAEIDEAAATGRRYIKIAAERNQLGQDVCRLEEEIARLERQLKIVDLSLALRPRWTQLAEIGSQLAELGDAVHLPTEMVARFESLQSYLRKRAQQLAELKKERRQAREAARKHPTNAALLRNAPRIEALLEQRDWLLHLQKQAAQLKQESEALDAELSSERQQLGVSEAAQRSDWSEQAGRRLRPLARVISRCEQAAADARQALDAARVQSETLRRQVESGLSGRASPDLSAALDDAGTRVSLLRRRVQMEERLDQTLRHHAELEEQSRELLDKQMLPLWVVGAFGIPFVLGAMLALAGIFLPAVGAVGMWLSVIGLLGVVGSAGGKFWIERSHRRRLEDTQRQLGLLQSQIRHTQEERETLDKQLPRGGGPLVSRLEAAEKELAALEELVPLDTRSGAARADRESAERNLERAESDARAAKRRWREALASLGLPVELSPKKARSVISRAEHLRELARRAEARRDELRQRRGELEALTSRVLQLARDCGAELAEHDAEFQLQLLADAMTEQQKLAAERSERKRRDRALARTQARLEQSLSRLRHKRRQILIEVGAGDEHDFRSRAARATKAMELRSQRDVLDREIVAALAGICSRDAIDEQLAGERVANLETRQVALDERLTGLRADLGQRLEQRGQRNEQLRHMTEDRRLAEKQLELAALDQRLLALVHRWRVLGIAGRTLERVRSVYEQERQPETLREASRYLERMTDGRYLRVWTPLGEQSLCVDDAGGESLPVEVLSRGTREQLFLCLRMALVSWYARQGARLPLVLDDVLVNFDAARARAAAAALSEFALSGHQLLVFTCHEHLFDLFAGQDGATCKLPDHRQAAEETLFFRQRLRPAVSGAEQRDADAEERRPRRSERRRRPQPELNGRARRKGPRTEPSADSEWVEEGIGFSPAGETPDGSEEPTIAPSKPPETDEESVRPDWPSLPEELPQLSPPVSFTLPESLRVDSAHDTGHSEMEDAATPQPAGVTETIVIHSQKNPQRVIRGPRGVFDADFFDESEVRASLRENGKPF